MATKPVGSVYLARQENRFIYKIGASSCLIKRIKKLQSELLMQYREQLQYYEQPQCREQFNNFKIILIWHRNFYNYFEVEKYLHKRFNNKRVKAKPGTVYPGREWFNLSKEDVAFIKNFKCIEPLTEKIELFDFER